ncbi:putative secologanin synthase [Helianthus anomalus]
MEVMTAAALVAAVTVTMAVAVYGWRFLKLVWLLPKAMEKSLREQGLNGNHYRFLFGDMKEMVQMTNEAKLKPIKLTDSILTRVIPFYDACANTHGTYLVSFSFQHKMKHHSN